MNFARKRLENGADAGGIAEHTRGGDHKLLPGAQSYGRTTGERAGSNLGALQGGENGNRFVKMKGGGAQVSDIFGMVCVRAVGEIEARNVHARAQEAIDNSVGAASPALGWISRRTCGSLTSLVSAPRSTSIVSPGSKRIFSMARASPGITFARTPADSMVGAMVSRIMAPH